MTAADKLLKAGEDFRAAILDYRASLAGSHVNRNQADVLLVNFVVGVLHPAVKLEHGQHSARQRIVAGSWKLPGLST